MTGRWGSTKASIFAWLGNLGCGSVPCGGGQELPLADPCWAHSRVSLLSPSSPHRFAGCAALAPPCHIHRGLLLGNVTPVPLSTRASSRPCPQPRAAGSGGRGSTGQDSQQWLTGLSSERARRGRAAGAAFLATPQPRNEAGIRVTPFRLGTEAPGLGPWSPALRKEEVVFKCLC